jgi:hypothetical protein
MVLHYAKHVVFKGEDCHIIVKSVVNHGSWMMRLQIYLPVHCTSILQILLPLCIEIQCRTYHSFTTVSVR